MIKARPGRPANAPSTARERDCTFAKGGTFAGSSGQSSSTAPAPTSDPATRSAPAASGHDLCRIRIEAADRLNRYTPDRMSVSRWQTRSQSTTSLRPDQAGLRSRATLAMPPIEIHRDDAADRIATSYNAEAVTIGRDVYFARWARTPGILAHEAAHAMQSHLPGTPVPRDQREAEARAAQRAAVLGESIDVVLPGPALEPMAHPVDRILRGTSRWLLRRTTRALTRHIARHGHRIAGRAVHTVFRNPRAIRRLVSRAVREASAIARRATRHGADDVLEEGGTRIFRQATGTPGKYRFVIERNFERAIGTRGETILRVVIDMSGRIVTAFPVERFMAAGVGAAALAIFDARTADASDRVHALIEADTRAREEAPTDWGGEIIDFFNPISSGDSLNEGEELTLDIDRVINETTNAVIREIEESEQMTLGEDQRAAIRDLAEVAIGSPMAMEELEDE